MNTFVKDTVGRSTRYKGAMSGFPGTSRVLNYNIIEVM